MKLVNKQTAAFVLVAGIAFTAPVFAQTDTPPVPPAQTDAPPPPPPPGSNGGAHRGGPEQRMEMLQHALNLTPDQTTQVKSIFDGQRTKMEALRSNSSLAPEDRRTQMMAIRQETNTKVRAVLTPDQVTKYDQLEARMREHRPGAGMPGSGMPSGSADGPPPPPGPPTPPAPPQ